MNAADSNAVRLVEDAELLLERERFPSATALAILAIEEAGKASILRGLAVVQKRDKALAESWRSYRSHTKKNAAWLLPQLFGQGARGLDDFRPMFDKDSDHPFLLDQVKQISLYTDCLGKANWSIPQDVIDKDLARSLVWIARILSKHEEATPKEIELWVKHMESFYTEAGTIVDYDGAKIALRNWYADMQEHGLTTQSSEDIDAFLRGQDRDV